MSNQIEIKATVVRNLFYNMDSMFGVYAFEPNDRNDGIEINKWGNFVVNGECPELFVGKTYDIIIEPSTHAKYGDGYSFVAVKSKKPSTIEEQQAYIRALLKENQAKAILDKYSNHLILDMMKDGTFDYSDIKGIKEKTYQKIKDYLFKNLEIQEAIVELRELKITFKAMKKLIDHFGSASVVVHKIKENIYNLCKVDMFGFKKVDEYALNRGDSKTNQNRIIAAMSYILEEDSTNGHSWLSEKSLFNQLKELLQIDSEYIEQAISYAKEEIEDLHFDQVGRVALTKNYFYEKEIMKKLIEMMNRPCKTKSDDADSIIEKLEQDGGFTYTDEQTNAIKQAINKNIFILNGKGGVGKSFTVKGILKTLKDYTYCCCALSGKAAKILADHGLESRTIHRMLGVTPEGKFEHNQKNRMPYDVIVLDEASMVNNYLFYSILSAIKDDGKIIIVGDSGQLAPIGTAAIFQDLLNAGYFPQQELTIIQRQAAKSGILSAANTIREGSQINGRYNYENKSFGELKDMVLIPMQNKENIADSVLDICRNYKHKSELNDFQVITGLKSKGNLSVKKLNQAMQGIFNDLNKPFVKRGGYEYRVNDKVIQCGNNYSAGAEGDVSVFNGTLGTIQDIEFDTSGKDKHKLWIHFEGIDECLCYEKEELDMIELAYAITCHRSQGSTIKNVLFTFDYGSYNLLSRQFVYTGITRASKGCVVICENAALHHAIRTDHSGVRRTFLYDLLMEEVNSIACSSTN